MLVRPRVYEAFSRALGGDRARTRFVRDFVRPAAGARVLDVGCGPADLVPYLGDVRYTGIDISARYIERARSRFTRDGVEFRVADAAGLPADLAGFDIAIAAGVLHHLDDASVRTMAATVAAALLPTGRFVALENAIVPGQPWLARMLISSDRGRHVREPGAYRALIAESFATVETSVVHDLLRVPYTHCVLSCSGPCRR